MLFETRFYGSIKSVGQLDTLLNPANKELEKDEQKDLEKALALQGTRFYL